MDSGINVRQLADIIYPKVTYFNLISPSISFFFFAGTETTFADDISR